MYYFGISSLAEFISRYGNKLIFTSDFTIRFAKRFESIQRLVDKFKPAGKYSEEDRQRFFEQIEGIVRFDPEYDSDQKMFGEIGTWLISQVHRGLLSTDKSSLRKAVQDILFMQQQIRRVPVYLQRKDSDEKLAQWAEKSFGGSSVEKLREAFDLIIDQRYDMGFFRTMSAEQVNDIAMKFKPSYEAPYTMDDLDEDEIVVAASFGDWVVLIPETYKASIVLGDGTSWCVSDPENDWYYERYTKDGPLYLIFDTKSGKRFMAHKESQSFMDIEDKPAHIEWKNINVPPELNDFMYEKIGIKVFDNESTIVESVVDALNHLPEDAVEYSYKQIKKDIEKAAKKGMITLEEVEEIQQSDAYKYPEGNKYICNLYREIDRLLSEGNEDAVIQLLKENPDLNYVDRKRCYLLGKEGQHKHDQINLIDLVNKYYSYSQKIFDFIFQQGIRIERDTVLCNLYREIDRLLSEGNEDAVIQLLKENPDFDYKDGVGCYLLNKDGRYEAVWIDLVSLINNYRSSRVFDFIFQHGLSDARDASTFICNIYREIDRLLSEGNEDAVIQLLKENPDLNYVKGMGCYLLNKDGQYEIDWVNLSDLIDKYHSQKTLDFIFQQGIRIEAGMSICNLYREIDRLLSEGNEDAVIQLLKENPDFDYSSRAQCYVLNKDGQYEYRWINLALLLNKHDVPELLNKFVSDGLVDMPICNVYREIDRLLAEGNLGAVIQIIRENPNVDVFRGYHKCYLPNVVDGTYTGYSFSFEDLIARHYGTLKSRAILEYILENR